ncbi:MULTISPECIES: carbon-nitrogen hydrolase family protein [Streptomyces]|uniref:Carbon-nitrogen hydrolase family protein n=3 Tax=Streptomyces TaxID=1883 RepID=A0ABD5E2P9_9ACTN|nr:MULTISPECIES: carbon-nitrogen hydrolase family protein [unclassified Streptomyces]ASY35944.1 carbon-nitrogen hydrolase [Streptomyces sp. CLI2509]MDT0415729.1 carbon-nitrogen hydrolase family protein [Streptomyces sp. DSM 41982]MYX24018.1 carbon-nitrogen hydrolase [Streptomyces sp. SID8380]
MSPSVPPAPPLRLALAQSSGTPGDVRANLDALDALAARAASSGAHLLVAPELFLSGYAPEHRSPDAGVAGSRSTPDAPPLAALALEEAEAVAELGALARRHGLAVLAGYPERAGSATYNSALLVGPDGAPLAAYRKTHLYGPYERAVFTAGDRAVVQAELRGVRLGVLICYDVEFPENVRAHADAGTEVLLVPTALLAPYDFVARSLVPVRAFESQLHIAYVNRTGPEGGFDFVGLSCLAAPDGTAPARAGAGPELLLAEADPALLAASRAANPYLADRRTDLYR